MNGIIINIDPVILYLGDYKLLWYSLTVMLAIVAAVLIAVHQGKKRGSATGENYFLALRAVIAGIVGARLFHVVVQFGSYIRNPVHMLHVQHGGLAIWGVKP